MWKKLACLVLGLGLVAAGDEDLFKSEHVVDLKSDSIDQFLKDNKVCMVEFYATWCGHCKTLAPIYGAAAEKLKKEDIQLAKINCHDEAKKCESFEVQGFPTLKAFVGEHVYDFEESRTEEDIKKFMLQFKKPAITEVTASNVEEFRTHSGKKVNVLGVFASKTSEEYKTFDSLAHKLRTKFDFGVTFDASLSKTLGSSAPAIVLYKSFSSTPSTYTGPFDAAAIEAYLKQESVPLVDDINAQNYQMYIEFGLPMFYYFYNTAAERQSMLDTLNAIGTPYKGAISFVLIDATKFGAHAENLNLKQEFPAIVIHRLDKDLKYTISGKLDQDNIKKFLKDFVEGKVSPILKSAPIPESNNGPVKIIVGKEFDKIVMDPSKNVFVEIYAPWCGHCKKLAPIFDRLGEKFASDSSIVIAKMDHTENDFPETSSISIQGYPTLMFFKAGTNEIVDYDGPHELESLVKFVEENSGKASTGHEEL